MSRCADHRIPVTTTNTHIITIDIPHFLRTIDACFEVDDTGFSIKTDIIGSSTCIRLVDIQGLNIPKSPVVFSFRAYFFPTSEANCAHAEVKPHMASNHVKKRCFFI